MPRRRLTSDVVPRKRRHPLPRYPWDVQLDSCSTHTGRRSVSSLAIERRPTTFARRTNSFGAAPALHRLGRASMDEAPKPRRVDLDAAMHELLAAQRKIDDSAKAMVDRIKRLIDVRENL